MATQQDTAGAARAGNRECYAVERERPIEVLYQRITQANALMQAAIGGGFEAFHELNADQQQEYLWTVAELLADARVAFNRMGGA
ncbi:MAG: hypothetical protein IPK27_03225 [Rhodanobacteraceae bacterium]|nr:hypothetical protein [Rhodanobacteraceae bacterium]